MRWHIGMGKRKNASDAFIFYFKASHAFRKRTCHLYLHCDKSVINHHFFCQEICSYSSFVLITELLIHILVHQRCLPNPVETKKCLNQHLEGKKNWRTNTSICDCAELWVISNEHSTNINNAGHNKMYIPFMKQSTFLRIYIPPTNFPIWKAHKRSWGNERLLGGFVFGWLTWRNIYMPSV